MADEYKKVRLKNKDKTDTLYPETDASLIKGTLTIEQGGTGAEDVETARKNLGIYSTEEVDEKIKSVEGDVTSLDGRIDTLESDNTTNKSNISDLQTRVSSAEANITTNAGNITTNTSNISSLQSSVNSLNSELETVKNSVPTKTSDLTNDSDFTTKTYVEDLIANITEFNVDVVETLPSVGDRGTIYLIKHEHETGDTYDEYIYVETTGEWEKIGNTDINLDDYTTLTAFNELSKYVDEIEERLTAAENSISKKADKEDLDNLSDEVTTNTSNITSLTSRIETDEQNISTNTTNITTNTNNITTNTNDIATIKDTYAKKDEIPTDDSELANGAGYITESALSEYAKSSDLSNYVTTTTFNTTLSDYAKTSDIPEITVADADTIIQAVDDICSEILGV